MSSEIRTLTAPDRAAAHHLRTIAFRDHVRQDHDPAADGGYIPDDRRVGAFVDGRLVAHAGAWAFGQFFGGRELPMGGVGGVTVAPEVRGRGHGHAVLRTLLEVMRDDGDAVSMLYPTVPGLYRALGWEYAGVRLEGSIATVALRDVPAPAEHVDVRPLDRDADRDALHVLLDADAATGQGRVRPSASFHDGGIDDDDLLHHVAWRDDRIVGHLAIEKSPPDSGDHHHFRQHVSSLVATDHDTWLALWRLVGSSHPVCRTTTFLTRPHEPLYDALRTTAPEVTTRTTHWMLRLIDARAAMAARGWPAHVDVEVHLNILDHVVPANAGPHVLRVVDGEGTLVPGGSGDASLGIGALAQLHSGHATAAQLAWARRINSPSREDVAALDAAFRAPQPWEWRYF